MRSLGTKLIHRGLWDRLGRRAKFQNGGRENQLFKTSCFMRGRHTWSKAASRKPRGVHRASAKTLVIVPWSENKRKESRSR